MAATPYLRSIAAKFNPKKKALKKKRFGGKVKKGSGLFRSFGNFGK